MCQWVCVIPRDSAFNSMLDLSRGSSDGVVTAYIVDCITQVEWTIINRRQPRLRDNVQATTVQKYLTFSNTWAQKCNTVNTTDSYHSFYLYREHMFSYIKTIHRHWLLAKVLCPTQHTIGHFGDIPQANLLPWYGKTKPKHNKSMHSPIKTNVLQHKINTKNYSQV